MKTKKNTLLIIAGEESGDNYGSMLIHAIKKRNPDFSIKGIGGDQMSAAGAELICHIRDTAVMGAVEMLDKLSLFLKKYLEIKKILKTEPVLGVILIDYPDFNLRVAAAAKKVNIPVFYYISPQIWAWRGWRIHSIRRDVTKMIPILPFEKNFYENSGVPVAFAGHPLLDLIPSTEILKKPNDSTESRWKKLTIGLLPGSRKKEIRGHLPEMIEAAKKLNECYGSITFLLPVPKSIDTEFVRELIPEIGFSLKIVSGGSYNVMRNSDILITKSGTTTLEATIIGTPMVIVYRSSFFSILLARILVKVKYAGLPNLLAGKEIVKELLQENMTAANIVNEVRHLLDNKEHMAQTKKKLLAVKKTLGEPGASERVADIILKEISRLNKE